MRYLTAYERFELATMYDEDKIFYTGKTARKIAPKKNMTVNIFYDDPSGYYRIITDDHIMFRYQIVRQVGKGSHANVVECFDHKTKLRVAVKIFRHGAYFSNAAKNEIQNLKYIAENATDSKLFLKMLSHFRFRNHTCIVLEYLDSDISSDMEARNFKGYDVERVRKITLSLLKSVRSLHDINMVHCDIKPSNIGFISNFSDEVKLIDFNSSCLDDHYVAPYMQTRFFRAPEVILRLPFHKSVDMWSVGCVVYEMLTGEPLFFGCCEKDHMNKIMEILGVPDRKLVKQWQKLSSATMRYFTRNFHPINNIPCEELNIVFRNRIMRQNYRVKYGSRSLENILGDLVYPPVIEFLNSCFTWDPKKRLTAEEALRHRWILSTNLPHIELGPIKKMCCKMTRSISSPTLFKRKHPNYISEAKVIKPPVRPSVVKKVPHISRMQRLVRYASTWLSKIKRFFAIIKEKFCFTT